MMSVFESAWRVVAWLDESDAHSNLAFEYMIHGHPETKLAHRPECLYTLRKLWIACRALFARRLFRRTWVRQEVFAARELLVACGTYAVDAEALLAILQLLRQLEPTYSINEFEIESCLTWEHIPILADFRRRKSLSRHHLDLLETLVTSTDFGKMDPWDKVYGVLGMTGTATADLRISGVCHGRVVHVDYTKTVAEVFEDIARYLVHHSEVTYGVLCHNFMRRPTSSAMPTWVVNWASPHYDIMLDGGSIEDLLYIETGAVDDGHEEDPRLTTLLKLLQDEHKILGHNERPVMSFVRRSRDGSGELVIRGATCAILSSFIADETSSAPEEEMSSEGFCHFEGQESKSNSHPKKVRPRFPGQPQQCIFYVLYAQTNELYVEVAPDLRSPAQNATTMEQRLFRGYTSDQAELGDILAETWLSPLPFLLKPADTGRYTFPGPVFPMEGDYSYRFDSRGLIDYASISEYILI